MALQSSSLMREIVKISVLGWNRKILLLQNQLEKLEGRRYDIQSGVYEAMRNGEDVNSEVLAWLDEADEILKKGENIFEMINDARRNHLCGIMCRFRLARLTKKVTRDINSLRKDSFVISLPISGINNSSLANEVSFMDEVLKAVKDDDQNNVIGLCGVVGNSQRVAIQICKRAEEEKIFDEVVKVNVVSTHPNLYKIQSDLERKLGLEFGKGTEEKSLFDRGKIVNEKLLRTNVLVILYNVKKRFELRDVGFQSEYHMGVGSKVVVIASELNVCEEMGIQKICQVPNAVQDNNDSWINFKREAGYWIQKADRDCIAYEFVDQYYGGYSESKGEEICKVAKKMNEWIKRIEKSNGINVPDANEVNRRRMNLFTVAAEAGQGVV